MANFVKWIGGTLGWAFGGPVGAFLGFVFGSAIDNVTTISYSGPQNRKQNTTEGDFAVSLLILSAAVMKADGKILRSELEFVRRFFAQQFGRERSVQYILMLREILQKDIPVREVCMQVKQNMPVAARLQLLHYLFGISKADGQVHEKEVKVIHEIAAWLGISDADFNSLKAMYFRDVESDYRILEISPSASDEEVKKAYRKMAIKFHPDKVSGLGEEVQRSAKEKFQKLQQAYENIRKQRGMV